MTKSRLYAWGTNSHGQLGLGIKSEQSTVPRETDLSPISVDPRNIEKIVGGAGHTMIMDKEGRIYSCGLNDKNQTGHTDAATFVPDFKKIDSFDNERIIDIACGWDSSMALANNGRLFVWGSNSYGQLGITKMKNDAKGLVQPDKPIELDEGIKAMAMGLRHSAVVTTVGKVLVTGSGSKCQLGILDSDGNPVSRLSAFQTNLEDIAAVGCGQNHTVALKKTGEIYVWGDNKHGQLGFDKKIHATIVSPRELIIPEIGEIRELRVGWTHTSLVNADGRIFSWGRNTYGQLGNRDDADDANWMARRVRIDPKIRQLSIGSEHNVALAEDGTVFTWGWNEHGNCGNGSTKDVLTPEKLKISGASKAILVGSGAGHSFAIFTDDV